MVRTDQSVMNLIRGHDRGGSPQEGVSRGRGQSGQGAAREKHEAWVGEVQQELQDAVKKYESLERDSKTQGSKLVKARQSDEMPEPKPRAPSRKSRRPRRSQWVTLSLCKASL